MPIMPVNFSSTFIKVAQIISKINNSKNTFIAVNDVINTLIAVKELKTTETVLFAKVYNSIEYRLKKAEYEIAKMQHDFTHAKENEKEKLKSQIKKETQEYHDLKIDYINNQFNSLIKNLKKTKHVLTPKEEEKIVSFVNAILKRVNIEDEFSLSKDDSSDSESESNSYDLMTLDIEDHRQEQVDSLIKLLNDKRKEVTKLLQENKTTGITGVEQELQKQHDQIEENFKKTFTKLAETESEIYKKECNANRYFTVKDTNGFNIIPHWTENLVYTLMGAEIQEPYKDKSKLKDEDNFDPEIIKEKSALSKIGSWVSKKIDFSEKKKASAFFLFSLILLGFSLLNLTLGGLLIGSFPIFIGILAGELLLLSSLIIPNAIQANNNIVQQKTLSELENAKILGDQLLDKLDKESDIKKCNQYKELLNKLNSKDAQTITFNKDTLEEITDLSVVAPEDQEKIIKVRNFSAFKEQSKKDQQKWFTGHKTHLAVKTAFNVGILIFLGSMLVLDIMAFGSGIGFFVVLSLVIDSTFTTLTVAGIGLDVYSLTRNEKFAHKNLERNIDEITFDFNKKIKTMYEIIEEANNNYFKKDNLDISVKDSIENKNQIIKELEVREDIINRRQTAIKSNPSSPITHNIEVEFLQEKKPTEISHAPEILFEKPEYRLR